MYHDRDRDKGGDGAKGKGTVKMFSSDEESTPLKTQPKKAAPELPDSLNPIDVMKAIRDMESKLDQSLSEQNSFRSSIEKSLQNMQKSINETITAECKSVRDDLQNDIRMLSDRVDGVS